MRSVDAFAVVARAFGFLLAIAAVQLGFASLLPPSTPVDVAAAQLPTIRPFQPIPFAPTDTPVPLRPIIRIPIEPTDTPVPLRPIIRVPIEPTDTPVPLRPIIRIPIEPTATPVPLRDIRPFSPTETPGSILQPGLLDPEVVGPSDLPPARIDLPPGLMDPEVAPPTDPTDPGAGGPCN